MKKLALLAATATVALCLGSAANAGPSPSLGEAAKAAADEAKIATTDQVRYWRRHHHRRYYVYRYYGRRW